MLARESADISTMIRFIGTPDFGAALDAMLRAVAPFDLSVVFAFPYDARPILLHDGYTHGVSPQALKAYLGGAYLLDPFYVACNNGQPAGLWRMRELAPDQFFQSNFSSSSEVHPCVSMESGSLIEEVGFVVPLEEAMQATYSLMRCRDGAPFSDQELERLRLYEPIVREAIRSNWRQRGMAVASATGNGSDAMEGAFDSLCADRLTGQQRKIVRLILRGHSNLSIGRTMNIAEGTVRIHRKNIYRRLGISGQGALFRIFIDHLNRRQLY
ncbi:helix-turn-helix transcriptional regulator [Sinorhizobium garamanticum]|uniref:Helix-turn-helix transcriptional regulator n=1 Tax=Sinorhizobium garamanticum TaxID=680247 RepID=A0ABY8DE70_9HYPH|nr:helix-turn-helix transcriptional regulator [Sinorhizobium garamanticum]WEX88358.1 helix-turn-helix transcriptional regulator [Sinorhizobium garamanticum]